MSLLNNLQLQENNVSTNKLRPAKQLSVLQLSSKKKALSDVKNTFHQKTTQNIGKPGFTHGKINLGQLARGVFADKTNDICLISKPCDSKPQISSKCITDLSNEFENESIVTCTCEDFKEDDYADMLFKNIVLTKDTIENLALNWENPPFVSAKDIQELPVPVAMDCEIDSWMDDGVVLDSGNLQVDLAMFNVPRISFGDDLAGGDDYDSGIGL